MQTDLKKSLFEFVTNHKNEIKDLKDLESKIRAYKKTVEGTPANPTEYTLTKKAIIESWDHILKTIEANADDEVMLDVAKKKVIVKIHDQINGSIENVELSVTERKTVDNAAILDKLVLDGLITAEQLTIYKEDNVKVSKSFTFK